MRTYALQNAYMYLYRSLDKTWKKRETYFPETVRRLNHLGTEIHPGNDDAADDRQGNQNQGDDSKQAWRD